MGLKGKTESNVIIAGDFALISKVDHPDRKHKKKLWS